MARPTKAETANVPDPTVATPETATAPAGEQRAPVPANVNEPDGSEHREPAVGAVQSATVPAPDPTPEGVPPGDIAPTTPTAPTPDPASVPDSGDVEVTMLLNITGTRNGEKWPAVGGTITLPAAEAEQYVANGYARLSK